MKIQLIHISFTKIIVLIFKYAGPTYVSKQLKNQQHTLFKKKKQSHTDSDSIRNIKRMDNQTMNQLLQL